MRNKGVRLIEREKDLVKLSEMYNLFYREVEMKGRTCSSDEDYSGEIVSRIGSKNYWGYFSEVNGSVSGFILCKRYSNSPSKYIKPGDVEIESFVDADKRGCGLGKILKNAAIESVVERSDGEPARVLSFVEDNNSANLAVLKKLGSRK